MFFTTRKTLIATTAIAAVLALAVACGGDDDEEGPSAATSDPTGSALTTCAESPIAEPIDGELLPIVISSDLAVGSERFVVGLIDQVEGLPLAGAEMHFKFFCYDSPDGTEAFESDPEAIVLTKTYTHTHTDGLIESHEAGETGAYVTYVDFDRPGTWGVEVTGTAPDGREIEAVRPTFTVSQESFGLSVGDPAPASVQPVLADVADITELDTSVAPIPEQHNLTVADAIASGKPTVVAFATPAFCQTQICGPIKEIFDDLYAAHKDEANFVHIEPYDLARMRSGDCKDLAACLVPAVNEWGLQTEPWVFIVGADGKIAAKFDGIASLEEMETALADTLGA